MSRRRVILTHDLATAWAHYADHTTEGWTMILENLNRMMEAT